MLMQCQLASLQHATAALGSAYPHALPLAAAAVKIFATGRRGGRERSSAKRHQTNLLYKVGEYKKVYYPPHEAASQSKHVNQARLPPTNIKTMPAKKAKDRPQEVSHWHTCKLKHPSHVL
jgi:hypothetical protein